VFNVEILQYDSLLTSYTSLHRVWNYDEAIPLNTFDNHNSSDRGISKLCLVNELDDSLLLVASRKFHLILHL